MRYPSRFPKSVPKRARDGTPKEGDCPTHRKWIRQQPCAVNNLEERCMGRVEAAHVRTGTDGGMGKKPHDKWCVPLCARHHREGKDAQHSIGERAFWALHGYDPVRLAMGYTHRSPDPKVKT